MNTILPWHNVLWQKIMQRWQKNCLPHALLLCGPTGMGKGVFAQCLAEALLCETPLKTGEESGSACGHCKPCHLLQAKTHPDLLQIQPADVGKQISIDQIRHLI